MDMLHCSQVELRDKLEKATRVTAFITSALIGHQYSQLELAGADDVKIWALEMFGECSEGMELALQGRTPPS